MTASILASAAAGDATPAPYTLAFTTWECGHHQARPADIPVHSAEQAILILQAIAAAINQPGCARAVLMDESSAIEVYLTDDYVDRGAAGIAMQRHLHSWGKRPVVLYGDAQTIRRLLAPELSEERDWLLGGEIDEWQPNTFVEGGMTVATTARPDEVLAAYRLALDDRERRFIFELPPAFRPAADVLASLEDEHAVATASCRSPAPQEAT